MVQNILSTAHSPPVAASRYYTMKIVTALLGAVTIALANNRVNAGLLGNYISKLSKNGALLL